MAEHHTHHAELPVEPDNPPSGLLMASLLGMTILMVAVAVGSYLLLDFSARDLLFSTQTSVRSNELIDLKTKHLEQLSNYSKVEGAEQFRVPIDQAIKHLVANPDQAK